jgi:long-chain acyl-CoA synthetase
LPDLSQIAAAALARDPKRAAVEFEGRWFNWGELNAIAAAVSDALEPSGDAPVIFIARNHPASLATLLALIATNRTIRMLYPFQSPEALARNIGAMDAGAVIFDARDSSDKLVEAIAAKGMAGVMLNAMAVEIVVKGSAASQATPPEHPQIEILTSGTTGPPKSFPLPFSLSHYVGEAAWDEEAMAAAPPGLLYFPLGNISGIYSSVPPLIKGQPVVLLDRFSIDAWREYVVRHRPTQSGIPPASMRQFLDANVPKEELASIKTMGSGAAPLDPELQRAFEDRYGIPILLSYGATEFGGPLCNWTPALHAEYGRAKLGSVGRPLPGAQVRVVDQETGVELPVGKTGLLHVISPRIGPDWIITSDLGHLDEDGFLFLEGRADGAIMRGGFKILPETIERALLLHPAVSEVSVVGVADERLGQVPGAAVCTRERVSAEALESHLRGHVLATHIPVHWRFVDELPRTPSFKIDRNAVSTLFA